MRILIVEDEIKIRRGMANLINNHTDHTVVDEAKNGEEGLELALKYQPDLIITDIRMPVMNGLEMIKALYEAGFPGHCVILSGYSEFEYAKQAIRYGVDDYLIKPLAPEDITGILDSVEKKISREIRKQQGTPEKILRDFILGSGEDSIEVAELSLACEFKPGAALCIIGAYLGSVPQEGRRACQERFEKIRTRFPDQKFYTFFIENTMEFICVTEDKRWGEIKREIELKLLLNALYHYDWVFAVENAETLAELGNAYKKLQESYPYGMVIPQGQMIVAEMINVEAEEYSYPVALEHQMQTAVYSADKERINHAGQVFMEAVGRQGTTPDYIRESYMRMANFLLESVKESNSKAYMQLQNLNLMKRIGLAVTKRELEGILKEELRVVALGVNQREDISNYTIKRAIDYIRNHYQESISLEMVASSLDITPEYLSTLFNREVGINFSVFMKRFRISHAKRLLTGTDKKIYEVALEVGYSDSKYFNRVFKEEVGVSPGDYRGLH